MATEIQNRTTYPYSAITLISVRFPDGSSASGVGAVIGRNDVLTATHVIYQPKHGGWATKIELYPGADANSTTYVIEDAPYRLGKVDWRFAGWPQQTFADDNDFTMQAAESQYDVAVIGLSVAVGDRVGWFGLDGGQDNPQLAYEIGYPEGSTGMMLGRAWVTREDDASTYSATTGNGTDFMGPGSSGGPLYVVGSDGAPYIIGVKSTAGGTQSRWADIGLLYEWLGAAIKLNDNLLQSSAVPGHQLTGTANNDTIMAEPGNDNIDGGAGIDTVGYSGARSNYGVITDDSGYTVSDFLGAGGTDSIVNIERLRFDDAALALDVDGNAGQAYRLYQAALNRTPDKPGLGAQIGGLDSGMPLLQIAQNFMDSPEFKLKYGANLSNSGFVTQLYSNVLHRAPDASGFAHQVGALDTNAASRAQLLVNFSESPENQAALIGVIQNGIEYQI
jgi:V8-like Glu-specific endopeptidase